MAKTKNGNLSGLRSQAKRTDKSLRRLERRLDELAEDHRLVMERLARLTADSEIPLGDTGHRPDRFRRFVAAPPPWGGGPPPWKRSIGPIAALEVPLEGQDPTAPLWATVSARLPEEITVVDDSGELVRYRYSAAGSTPQAPRYRRLADQFPQPPPPFPG
jgi:hypothetical protein